MTSTPEPVPHQGGTLRGKISVLIGTFMEFFDFASYGFLAATLGALFFPAGSPSTQLLSAFAVFGVAFLARPFGGALFGFIGDRFGRKPSLIAAVVMMACATGLIGLLPVHASAGAIAPALLVLLRCVQGLSVGGEFTGSSTLMIESAQPGRRGFNASFVLVAAAVGTIAGSLVVLLLTSTLSPADMMSFGWRIPFLVAFPLGAIGLYMRLHLEDTPVYKELKRTNSTSLNPFKDLRRTDIATIAIVAGVTGPTTLCFYFYTTYLNTYLSSTVGYARPQAILISTISLTVYASLCPLAGHLADRFGRKRLFLGGFLGMSVLIVPIFLLLHAGIGFALVGLLVYGLPMALINVILSPVMTEMFQASTRATGASLGHEIGIALISGSGPFVATALIAATGNAIVPAYYVSAMTLAAAILTIFAVPETYRYNLMTGAASPGEPAAVAVPGLEAIMGAGSDA